MKRQRRIALLSSHGGRNGAAKVVETLVRGLADEGCDLRLYHRPGAWLAGIGLDRVADLRPLDMGVRRLRPEAIGQLRHELAEWNASVLHSHGTTADRLSGAVRRFGQVATLATAHARVLHPHWRRHDRVVAPSRYTAEWYRRWHLVRPERLHLLTTGVPDPLTTGAPPAPADATRAALGLAPGDFVLTMVGDICARKKQSAAVALLADLVGRGIPARLLVVGSEDRSETPKVWARARDGGVADRIVLTGPRSDVPDILRASDCFLSTSRDEQGPLALVEAMALSLPVVATPVGWGADVLDAGTCGRLIPVGRAEAAAPFLAGLAGNRDEAARIGAAGRALYEARFGIDVFIRGTLALYDDLAGSKAAAPPEAAAGAR